VPVVLAAALAALAPDAAANAWARFLAPWRPIDRFTFTRVAELPERLVVPHGEPAPLVVPLRDDTRWRPETATARIGRQRPLAAPLADGRYEFTLPPQLGPATLRLAAGDDRERIRLEPMFRPEIATLEAEIELPKYLERPGIIRQDARGGTLVPVKGSTVSLVATANRDLASATVDGAEVKPEGSCVRTPPRTVDAESRLELSWCDGHGLAGAAPIAVTLAPRPDEPPALVASEISVRNSILLNTDTLRFKVAVRDDFGIRRVGLEWQAAGDGTGEVDVASMEKGDRLLQAGGSDIESLAVAATFCPDALGIQPQPIVLRAFAEDYMPGRGRAYAAPILLYIVDRAEHALLLNTRLQQLRQQASEVRDREMALLAANKEFRDLEPQRLLDADVQAKLEAQAAAEDSNAKRLDRLVDEGTELIREAAKNPEFDAGTLEDLSADVLKLADIAEKRMPSVADLLRQAAAAKLASSAGQGKPGDGKPGEGERGQPGAGKPGEGQTAGKPGEGQQGEPGGGKPGDSQLAGKPGAGGVKPGEQPPKVGEDRDPSGAQGAGEGDDKPPMPPTPQVVDKESSQQPKDDQAADPTKPGQAPGRFGLPSTQAGVAKPDEQADGDEEEEEPPADEALASAIEAQEALLAEFAKVADELAAVMARLEGSTFVKRLKLASREQGEIGSRIAGMAADAFGKADRRPDTVKKALGDVKEKNTRETEKVSALMDDLQAYFDRRQLPAFRTVLEEMKDLDALGSLRQLSDDIVKEAGMSIAQAEFWSDTFDRLADDLVPPPQGGGGGGGGGSGPPRASVPPEVVLELMKVLEDEVNLREDTRVAGQKRKAVSTDEFAAEAGGLADRQEDLADRIVGLVDRLLEEPDGEQEFGQEIQLFDKVEEVMVEAADILRAPDAGPKAIAAETEAIELMLQAQAASGNPGGGGGGGGGGGSPGGGSTGTASSLALALAGRGDRTTREQGGGEKEQATGTGGRQLPEEFRAGLDAYFNKFEKARQ
jgi:hypothetical protein